MRVPYLFERIKRPGAALTGMGRARLIAIPLQPFAGDPNRFLVRWGGGIEYEGKSDSWRARAGHRPAAGDCHGR